MITGSLFLLVSAIKRSNHFSGLYITPFHLNLCKIKTYMKLITFFFSHNPNMRHFEITKQYEDSQGKPQLWEIRLTKTCLGLPDTQSRSVSMLFHLFESISLNDFGTSLSN